jgi:uncharacterized protein YggU (UPF0235/DUF167 family)
MYIKVFVYPEARTEGVQNDGDGYSISVNTPASRGLANKRALQLLRCYLGPSKRVIRIVSGHHSPHKIVLIEDES